MRNGITIIGIVWVVASVSGSLAASEERYEQRDGRTFRVTTRNYLEPETHVRWEERQETVYKERYTTEVQESYRDVYSPVVEYQWEPRTHGWWNPFTPSTVAYHLVPRTRWELRREPVRMPVTRRELVPETRVVQVPRRELRMVERRVEEAVAVGEPTRIVEQSPTRIVTRPRSLGSVDVYTTPSYPR